MWKRLGKLLMDRRAFAVLPVILGVVGLLVLAYIIPQLLPLAIEQWQSVNTSAWNFTGATGAGSLWGLAPFMWIIGIFLMSIGLGFAIYELMKAKETL